MQKLRLAALAFAALLAATPAAGAGEEAAHRSWWIVRLGGAAAGSASEEVVPLGGGRIATRSALTLRLHRLGAEVEMRVASEVIEGPDGHLLSARSEQDLSRQTQVVEARVEGDRLHWRSYSGGGPAPAHESALALPGELPGPEAARRRTDAVLRRVGDRIELLQLEPELPAVLPVSRTLVALAEGPEGPLRVVHEEIEGIAGTRVLHLDAGGRLVRSTEPSPFGELALEQADEAAVRAVAGSVAPAELFAATLRRANLRLSPARETERLVVRLELDDPRLTWPPLGGGSQRLLRAEGAVRRVEVLRPPPPAAPASASAAGADPELAALLAPGPLVESAHPEIVRLAGEVAGGEPDPYRRALALAAWVHGALAFDPGIVLAPASELARARRGTCAGHAVLLAALARASGIPARFVAGLAHTGGVWAGHAWVELHLGGAWLPFDSALYRAGPADAARVALARDGLGSGFAPVLLGGLQLVGRLAVEIEEATVGGRELRAEPGAPPWSAAGDRYRNPGLGLSLALPAGWRLERADALWPESLVVSLAGPGGARAELREEETGGVVDAWRHARERLTAAGAAPSAADAGPPRSLGGRPGLLGRGRRAAGAAWADRSALQLLVVTGPAPRADLAALLAGLAWEPRPDAAR